MSNIVNIKRQDTWTNAVTGFGDVLRDKRMSSRFERNVLSIQDIEELWRSDDMAARIIETEPDEMLREGYEVLIEGDRDLSEAVMARMEDMEVDTYFLDALCTTRAHGGACIFMGADDGQRLDQPLDTTRIRTFDYMTLYTPAELVAFTWYRDPSKAKFGEVETYRVNPQNYGVILVNGPSFNQGTIVHESRFIRFNGIKTSRTAARSNHGFGDSVLMRCHEVIRDYQLSWGGASLILQDFVQTIYQMEGLATLIAEDKGQAIIKRAQAIDISRSIARAIMIDSKENFIRSTANVAGLSDMLQQFAIRLAAAARMPVTLLMGQAPAGLNATGASDIRFFYDHIGSAQRRVARPAFLKFLKTLFATKTGPSRGKEPDNWTIRFNPLYQPSEAEMVDVRFKQAQTDAIYIDRGVLLPEEVAESRFGGDEYSTETELDVEGRDVALREAEPEPLIPTQPNNEDANAVSSTPAGQPTY